MSSTDNIGQFPLCSPANTVTPVTDLKAELYNWSHYGTSCSKIQRQY